MNKLITLLCLLFLSSICHGQDAATYFEELGSKMLSSRNYSEALDLFNQSLDMNSDNAYAWIHRELHSEHSSNTMHP